MKKCIECGRENDEDVRFCGFCGKKIQEVLETPEIVNVPKQSKCMTCGNGNPEDAQFCEFCGTKIHENSVMPNSISIQAEAGNDEEKKKSSKGKKVVGIVVLVILLIGILSVGGLFVWAKVNGEEFTFETFFGNKTEELELEDEEEILDDEEDGEIEENEEKNAKKESESEKEENVENEMEEVEEEEQEEQQEEQKNIRHTYEFVLSDETWEEAYESAKQRNGYLVVINTLKEQEEIEELMKIYPSVHTVWLGAKRIDGEFQWITSEELTYVKWGPGEPNNENDEEIYLNMYHRENRWNWNDVPGDIAQYYAGKMGYIIEFEIEE